MQLRRFLITVLCSFIIFVGISAQDMTVRSMEPLPMDTYASTHKRLDLNGNVCAVVRVSLTVSGATFSGNVVGEVARDGSDYLVYMPQGSKKLWVKHPNYHELEVNFDDYGIARLQSLTTYRITVNAPQSSAKEQKKQTLTIKVTPSDAVVLIDNEMIEERIIELPLGSHSYNVAASGYLAQSGNVNLTSSAPGKLIIELDHRQVATQNKKAASIVVSQQRLVQQVQQPTRSSELAELKAYEELLKNEISNTTPKFGIDVGMSPQTFTVKGVSFTMMPVEGGTFTMGATPEMTEPYENEKPAHQVTLSSYYIGETEVTQELWQAVMGNNPSRFKGSHNPVEKVSWDDCQTFINSLNQLMGKKFRLPTEAEWEFAARGGNKSRHTQYSGSNNIDEVAWYNGNSGGMTHPVKQKIVNELGIYDMTGNVLEWCQNWFGDYCISAQTNPTGPTRGYGRVDRGGSWLYSARNCRLSDRSCHAPDFWYGALGLRLALSE